MKVAVLPIEEDELFRDERAAVRRQLAGAIERVAGRSVSLISFADVDAQTARSSQTSKKACAYEDGSRARRAQRQGWATTDLTTLVSEQGKTSELVVSIGFRWGRNMSFRAPWSWKKPATERYASAFAQLAPSDHSAFADLLLGGLGGIPDATPGPLSLCERTRPLSCAPETKEWATAETAMRACFDGRDLGRVTLLLEGGTKARCEIADLDETSGPASEREACLCKAALASPRAAKLAKRTQLAVRWDSPEIAGKVRPLLAVIETSGNLEAEEITIGGSHEPSRTRLTVDGLDAIASSLARCPAIKDTAVAELEVDDSGAVASVRVGGAKNPCIEKELRRAAFDCTDDGKTATVRLALRWPEQRKKEPKAPSR